MKINEKLLFRFTKFFANTPEDQVLNLETMIEKYNKPKEYACDFKRDLIRVTCWSEEETYIFTNVDKEHVTYSPYQGHLVHVTQENVKMAKEKMKTIYKDIDTHSLDEEAEYWHWNYVLECDDCAKEDEDYPNLQIIFRKENTIKKNKKKD